ncbi:MAG: peptidase S8, partial [Acidobacteriota bacterium]
YNLPPNDPKVMLFGDDPGTSSADVPEADLDLEWAGAVARNAQIIYVNSTDVISSLFYAIDNNVAPVISMSYGGCEIENTQDLRTFAQQANAQGITWVAASGDSGAAGCDFSAPTPQASKGNAAGFPASIPEVTAIGGTTLREGTGNYWSATNGPNSGSALGYIPEVAWNDSPARNELAATGGGASVFYPKPFWQSAPGVPDDGARDVPDISFAASPDHDGYLVQTQGSLAVFGGTSAGTPVFAGLAGLLNQYLGSKKGVIGPPGLGNINPVLYRLAQSSSGVFHDVVSGDNFEPCAQGSPDCVNGVLGYAAGPGYDLATGLGSVDAWQLAKQWNTGVTSTTSLTATPASAALGDTVTLTATVTSNGTSRPTGTVVFLSCYNVLGTVNLTPGPGTTATATLGVAMVRIAEGPGTVSALYNGDGVVASSGGSSFVDLRIPSSGSLVIPSIDPNPVYQFGNAYVYTVTLQEVAGVATKITGFTVDGTPVSLSLLPRTSLAAFGFLQTTLASGTGITPTAGAHVFTFTGQDSNGKTWSQSVTAVFLPSNAPAITPSILLSSSPRVVLQNASANPNCQWSQQLTIQEQGGFLTNLTQFQIGTTNLSGQIQQFFGTTRLAPYGVLYGNFCWNSSNVTPSKTFTLGGVGEIGSVSSVATVTYANAAPNNAGAPATLALSQPALLFSAPQPAPGLSTAPLTQTLDLTFTGGDSVWTVSTLPANLTSRWLSVTPNSGQGPGRVTVQASPAGLSAGVYRAYVTFQATNAFPQAINVPVTLVVGGSDALSIGEISNVASLGLTGAPGAKMQVIGLNLAPSAALSARIPLSLTLAGVSATVNGVTAPLYSVSPGLVNLQVPYETAPGTAVLAIHNNGKIAWREFPVAIAAPGIFSSANGFLAPVASAPAGATVSLYVTGDGDVTPTLATGEGPSSGTATNRLPQPRLPLTVTVGGTPAVVTFRGIIAGTVGVTQVNFTIPPGTVPGVQPVVVSVGGAASQPVNMTVTAP